MSSQEQLESHIESFDPGLKLFVAIAAKVSTLHVLAGRYTQHLTLDDLSPPSSSPSSPSGEPTQPTRPTSRDPVAAQRELDAEQQRIKVLMRETITQATHWLVLVCRHFEVDLATLPENPDTGMRLPEALEPLGKGAKEMDEAERSKAREKKEWDVVWELLLVSLGLVGTGLQAEEPAAKAQSASKRVGSKVGGLFSSSESKPDSAAVAVKDVPPPLDYTALSRSLVVGAAEVLGISERVVADAERAIAQFLFFQLQAQEQEQERQGKKGVGDKMEWDEAAQEYRQKQAKKGNTLKWAATGAGFILGGVAIGLTGGLAAPALVPVLAGTFGIAAFSGAGGAVLIGTLLGLGGDESFLLFLDGLSPISVPGYRTHRRMKGLQDVSFEPVKDEDAHEFPQIPSLVSTIVASGFLLDLKDSVDPWRATFRSSKVDAYALKADPQTFLEAGRSLESFVKNKIITMGGTEIIKRTALAAVYAGVALPLTVFQGATTAFDSDFSRCRDKAKKAGVLLAEILEKQVQGKRPAVLIGYGPGASLIFSCLVELHRRQLGHLVYSATLISLPEAPSPVAWASARSVVAHELVNAYSKNDYVLAIAARVYTLSSRIAGLGPVKVEGITNLDVSDLIPGHLEIRQNLPEILDRVANQRREREERVVEGLSTG
ncbi:hypothetical protein JCM5296_001960 [Sporobolomyces johnsonii]